MLYSLQQNISKGIIWIVAIFYSYGALIHLMNILGFMGFDWLKAPLKWQLLDVLYLTLDILVAVGFFLKWKIAYICFYIAATSQIILYTVFKTWIIDVPKEFAVSSEQISGLDALVVFHLTTIALITVTLASNHNTKFGIK